MNTMRSVRILLLVILILSSISLLFSETNEEKAEKHFNLGLDYGLNDQVNKAIEEFKLAIKYKPDDAYVHYILGIAYEEKGLIDKAIEEYKLAIKYKPDFVDAHCYLGVLYGEQGLIDKKIEEYKLAIKYKPDFAEVHFGLGVAYSHKGLTDKAIEEYKMAIKYKPGYAQAHYNLGGVYTDKGLTDKAIEELKLAVKYKSDDAKAHCRLGFAYYRKRMETTSADYFYKGGLLYLQQGDREMVLTTIDAMKDFTPDSPLISLLLEKLYAEDIEQTPKDEDIEYSGSGFIIHNDGFIVTNYHIIEGMKNIEIYLPSKDAQYKAKIFIKDINNDIALLIIDDSRFTKEISNILFGLGSSSDIKVGQEVYTIGFPMGDILGKSAKLSTGVVNSLYGILDDPTLIQISNPIQPGNSGGALFNSNGDVIGIVIASLNAKYFYENADIIPQNVNFAIKVDYLKNLISMLPDGEEILNRKSQISNLSLENQFGRIKPFVVNIKAY